jgi:hypothetical protein
LRPASSTSTVTPPPTPADRRQHADAGRDDGDLQCRRRGTARRRAADEALGEAGLAVNIGGYIGFNSVWQTVVGNTDRRPTPEEIERMRAMIRAVWIRARGACRRARLQAGYFARTEEVIKVVDAAKSRAPISRTTIAITPESNYSSKVGIAETVAIGEKSGLVRS